MSTINKEKSCSKHSDKPSPKNQTLIEKALKNEKKIKVGIVNPITADTLLGPILAAEKGLTELVLLGPKTAIQEQAKELGKDISNYEIIDTKDEVIAAKNAALLAKEKKIDAVMKGLIHTSIFMKALLDKENGIRTSRRVSHCFTIDVPSYEKLLILTDCAINIDPDLDTKKSIIENAIELANALDVTNPQVALLSFIENVNASYPSTTDAAILCKMVERGQIKGCVADGPISLDLAVSEEARIAKNFSTKLASNPDIFVFPNLDAANISVKMLDYLAYGQSAGLVIGLKVPVLLMRRSSPAIEHLISFALANLYSTWKN